MPTIFRSQAIRLVAAVICSLMLLATPATASLATGDEGGDSTGRGIESLDEQPFGPEPRDAGDTALVSIGSLSLKPGEQGIVELRLDDADNIAAFALGFTFDSAVAEVTNTQTGPLAITAPGVPAVNSSGEYSAAYFAATGQSGDFMIAALTFEAVGAPGSGTTFEVSVDTLVDGQGNPIAYQSTDGTFDIEMVYDFGDAPSDYPTILADTGARHGIVPGFHLGSALDWEEDGLLSSDASGDDMDGDDDEDGVAFTSTISPDRTAWLDVTASGAGYLDAWIDFNDDGDWADTAEQIFDSEELTAGANALSFRVPLDAVLTDSTFARFRFSSSGGLSADGLAADGEVEDYEVEIEPVPPDPPTAFAAFPYSPSAIALDWTRGTGADTTIVRRDTAGYPASPTEGTGVYSGGETSCVDSGLDAGTLYYYSAWSYYSATGLDSDSAAQVQQTTLPAERDWTFMVYMDADNNLEGMDELDLDEMMDVGSTTDVSIVVQHDRYTESGTWRYYIGDGQLFVLDEMDEQNMGDPRDPFGLHRLGHFNVSRHQLCGRALGPWDRSTGRTRARGHHLRRHGPVIPVGS